MISVKEYKELQRQVEYEYAEIEKHIDNNLRRGILKFTIPRLHHLTEERIFESYGMGGWDVNINYPPAETRYGIGNPLYPERIVIPSSIMITFSERNI